MEEVIVDQDLGKLLWNFTPESLKEGIVL